MEGRRPKLQPPGSVESSLKVPAFCNCAPFSIQIGPSGAPPLAPVVIVPSLTSVTPSNTTREQRLASIAPVALAPTTSLPGPATVAGFPLIASEPLLTVSVDPAGIVSGPLLT